MGRVTPRSGSNSRVSWTIRPPLSGAPPNTTPTTSPRESNTGEPLDPCAAYASSCSVSSNTLLTVPTPSVTDGRSALMSPSIPTVDVPSG